MKRYTTVFRCKGLADGSTTLIEMAASLEAAAKHLREMAEAGVTLDDEMAEAVADDYAFLATTNKDVAKKYGLEKE
jgi:hypothetical protein